MTVCSISQRKLAGTHASISHCHNQCEMRRGATTKMGLGCWAKVVSSSSGWIILFLRQHRESVRCGPRWLEKKPFVSQNFPHSHFHIRSNRSVSGLGSRQLASKQLPRPVYEFQQRLPRCRSDYIRSGSSGHASPLGHQHRCSSSSLLPSSPRCSFAPTATTTTE